ncbi:MAG TPA: hypothetical protein DDY91_22235 [Planctomycetaceae bacterium]|jgi:hypothetical protein|nr:hypothetical protein [Planctomycetaceae bacterium]
MQGFVLKEFIKYAGHRFGPRMIEQVIAENPLESNCQFACWKYVKPGELNQLLAGLSQKTGLDTKDLLVGYGQVMFQTIINMPLMQPVCRTLFEFLESVETGFYAELEDLFPDVELPGLACRRLDAKTLEVVYTSPRRLGDLAEGLLRASIAHFDECVAMQRFDDPADAGRVRFVLTRE